AEDGIRDWSVTGVQTCALPIWPTTRWMLRTWPRLARMRWNISARPGSSGSSGAPPRREIGVVDTALIQFRHRKILPARHVGDVRSEEHTSELQSLTNLVCRLLL